MDELIWQDFNLLQQRSFTLFCTDVNRACLYGCFNGNPLCRKEKDIYRTMAKFGALILINLQSVLSPGFTRISVRNELVGVLPLVGDVFGAPLAVEALLAFFMESTFIGLWIFGWDRLPKKIHLLSIWLVSLGTIMSAFGF
ncbi:cytochrome ubiquinol oxidase subunit I [Bacillus licheniformis]|nr:cytochrome ubiquinol oxidase subunit I [Bacillus licheniformis]